MPGSWESWDSGALHQPRSGHAANQVASSALQRATVCRVAGVAPQAQKHGRLMEQVVGDGPVRIVADGTALRYGSMFPHKGPLLFRMAFEAQLIECQGFQASVILPVAIVAIGTADLAFPDRMM